VSGPVAESSLTLLVRRIFVLLRCRETIASGPGERKRIHAEGRTPPAVHALSAVVAHAPVALQIKAIEEGIVPRRANTC